MGTGLARIEAIRGRAKRVLKNFMMKYAEYSGCMGVRTREVWLIRKW